MGSPLPRCPLQGCPDGLLSLVMNPQGLLPLGHTQGCSLRVFERGNTFLSTFQELLLSLQGLAFQLPLVIWVKRQSLQVLLNPKGLTYIFYSVVEHLSTYIKRRSTSNAQIFQLTPLLSPCLSLGPEFSLVFTGINEFERCEFQLLNQTVIKVTPLQQRRVVQFLICLAEPIPWEFPLLVTANQQQGTVAALWTGRN